MSVRLRREAHPTALLGGITEITFQTQTEAAWLQCCSFQASDTAAKLCGNAFQDKTSLKSQYVEKLNTCHLTNGVNARFSNKYYIDTARIC